MKAVTRALAFAVVLLSCSKKTTDNTDYTAINNEKDKIVSSYNTTKSYNDTLVMIYDTVKIKAYNHYCLIYDSLYHKSDSLFGMHYNSFAV